MRISSNWWDKKCLKKFSAGWICWDFRPQIFRWWSRILALLLSMDLNGVVCGKIRERDPTPICSCCSWFLMLSVFYFSVEVIVGGGSISPFMVFSQIFTWVCWFYHHVVFPFSNVSQKCEHTFSFNLMGRCVQTLFILCV